MFSLHPAHMVLLHRLLLLSAVHAVLSSFLETFQMAAMFVSLCQQEVTPRRAAGPPWHNFPIYAALLLSSGMKHTDTPHVSSGGRLGLGHHLLCQAEFSKQNQYNMYNKIDPGKNWCCNLKPEDSVEAEFLLSSENAGRPQPLLLRPSID